MADGWQYPALAAVAARAATAGSPAVLFNVQHYGARTPTGRPAPPTGIAPPTAPDQPATETLTFHLAGTGFRLHTWAPETPSVPAGEVSGRRIPPRVPSVEDGGFTKELYGGTVVINPNFLYDTAQSTEILLTLSQEAWLPDFVDSLLIGRAYRAMTGAAAAVGDGQGMPILFLQSPVAPYRIPTRRYRDDGSGENPRVANGMALRMLVGLDGADPTRRLALVRALADTALDSGFGLQVTDRRFGRVRGEWWAVVRPDQNRYDERRAELTQLVPAGRPSAARLLTFVGAGRVGSSAAIAADLAARNVGILAVAEASLQGVAFVNVMVPVAPARQVSKAVGGTYLPIAQGLGAVASECGLTKRQDTTDVRPIGGTPAASYAMLSTGPVTPRLADAVGPADRPLWLSWDLPLTASAGAALPDVAQLVLSQLLADEVVGTGRVDYYRARVVPSGRVRGRAKLSVDLDAGIGQTDVPTTLSVLCPRTEREVVSKLVRHGVPLRSMSLRLAWRERWLGRAGSVT